MSGWPSMWAAPAWPTYDVPPYNVPPLRREVAPSAPVRPVRWKEGWRQCRSALMQPTTPDDLRLCRLWGVERWRDWRAYITYQSAREALGDSE